MARLMLQDLPAPWAWLEWAQALGECLDEGRAFCALPLPYLRFGGPAL